MAPYFFFKIIEKKFNKHLVGSKKCCTFALAFGKEEKSTGYSAVGSVPGLGPGGRVFESRCPDNKKGDWAFSSAGSEHLPYKQRVGGSNPSTPTILPPLRDCFPISFFYHQHGYGKQ